MQKRLLLIILITLMLISTPIVSFAATIETFFTRTETTYWDPEKTQDGYTLFSPMRTPENGLFPSYLIDMQGRVINIISTEYIPGEYTQLLEDGTFLRLSRIPEGDTADTYKVLDRPGRGGIVERLDWDGNVIWSYEAYSTDLRAHHDAQRIYNKTLGEYTYLLVMWFRKSGIDAGRLGADPTYTNLENAWSVDGVMEVNEAGEIVWSWSFSDHLVQNIDPALSSGDFSDTAGVINRGPTYGLPSDYPGKLDINCKANIGRGTIGPRNDWNHLNTSNYDPTTGHILISSRKMSEIYIIDHDGTFVSSTDWDANISAARSDDGDFLYRFGNPSIYGAGDFPSYNNRGDQQLWGQHQTNFISSNAWEGGPALPGAGNIILFDNGDYDPFDRRSRGLEINPYVMDDQGTMNDDYFSGNYFDPLLAGTTNSGLSNQFAWSFTSATDNAAGNAQSNSLYSRFISGVQRMPNGNTLICSGISGHIFEITADGEVVWEYISPHTGRGINTTLTTTDAPNLIFRAYRYLPDYPGLAGKDLTPGPTITGALPGNAEIVFPSYPTPTGWGTSGLTSGEGGGGAAGGSSGSSGSGQGGY